VVGPIYSTPHFIQRGHGIGNFFGILFSGMIFSDIAENRLPEVSAGDMVSRHVSKSTKNLINKLSGRGRKRTEGAIRKQAKTNKRSKITKRDILS